ncbi:MAG: glucosaminidase domain-containing protein, partial [Butyricicoccaceae bacterium]
MNRRAASLLLCMCMFFGGQAFAAGTAAAKDETTTITASAQSTAVAAQSTAKPAQPQDLKAVSTGYNSTKVTWSAVSGAKGYRVYRSTDGGENWTRINTVSTTSCADSELTTGKAYTYTVRAYITVDGETILSSYDKKGVTVKPVPATVKLGEATKSGSSIEVTWSKVAGANGYRFYRKVPGGSWERIATVGSSTSSYTDSELKPGTYTYTVRAYRKSGDTVILGGYQSAGVSASILPSTPKLSSVSSSEQGITFKWSKVSNASGYRVYHKTGSGGWERIATLKSGSTVSYLDTAIENGKKYTYTVRAYTNTGNTVVLSGYDKTGLSATSKISEANSSLSNSSTASSSAGKLQATALKDLSAAEVVAKMGPLFTADQEKTDVLASVSFAQFILESGYGKSELAQNANNCFGMKCSLSGNTWEGSTWDGESIYTKETKETENGETITTTADFRKYPCVEDSIADHSAYLLGAKNGSELRYAGLKGEKDYRKAIQIIKDGGYATAEDYVDQICELIERWDLTQYD